ncbi:hypothetical protein LA080_015829 [Diaporthe eres]|nr:hypothetical protein LA080_015829 [Diaporthe eres]
MLGSEISTVLSPVSSPETEQYEVVGPCYLQGFMFGEGFLGPLPKGIRPVAHYEDGNGTRAHFELLDTISEEVRNYRTEVEVVRSVGLDIQYFDLV